MGVVKQQQPDSMDLGRTASPSVRTPTVELLAQRMPRVDSLTGLRWWAAFFVFTYHMLVFAPPPSALATVLSFGHFGVTFFFVLSGFVLTWSLGSISTSTFYWRRFARIYPAHLVALLFAIPVFYSFQPDPADTWVKPVSIVILGLCFVLLQGWFRDPTVFFAGNPASWSLTYEAFFYASHPVISKVLNRLRVRGATLFALGTVVVAFVFRGITVIAPESVFAAVPYPIQHLSEFVLGMALAWAFRCGWRPRVPVIVGLASVGLCLAAFVLLPRIAPGAMPTTIINLFKTELFTVACAIAVVSFASRSLVSSRSVFASRPMVRLGEWSYSFYLVHATFIYIAVAVFGHQEASWLNLLWYLALLTVGIAGAAALHHLVEKPMERRLRRWKDSRSAA